MRSGLPNLRFVALSLLLLALLPAAVSAQDDTPSLGDFARDQRKNRALQMAPQTTPQPPSASSTVIDNDNLSQIMEDAKNLHPIRSDKTVFSIDPATGTLKVSSPDVTCSLSFNARNRSLLIKPVLIEDLPLAELLKIDGPGSIQDESLQLEVFNGTDWDIREITVGLTLERKPGENAELAARARIIPAAQNVGMAPPTVERRSDVTLLYHLKAESKPFSTTAFHENIGITPGPDEDWRWSIVEAKGIRPSQAQSEPDAIQQPLFATPSALLPNSDQTTSGQTTDNQKTGDQKTTGTPPAPTIPLAPPPDR